MGLFGGRKKRAGAAPNVAGATTAPAAAAGPAGRSGRSGRSGLTGHPVCGLRAGMGKAEVIALIGTPSASMTSGQVRGLANVMIAGEDDAEAESEEYWLYKGSDAEPGFLFEVLLRSERLATVRVKPLGPDGRDLATVIRINDNGVQAVSPYREELGAQLADW
jgi:hypothetical protein